MKRPKVFMALLVILTLALSVAMAVPVYAADVGLTKGVTPPEAEVYNLTDTIHYTMSILNFSDVTGANENITVTAVWDVLPDGSIVYPIGPDLPYDLTPGQTQTYTYNWTATRTGRVVNTFYANGYQVSNFTDPFSKSTQKSSLVIGQEVGGTASLVNKVRLVVPWAALLACAAVVTLLVHRKRRHA